VLEESVAAVVTVVLSVAAELDGTSVALDVTAVESTEAAVSVASVEREAVDGVVPVVGDVSSEATVASVVSPLSVATELLS
jgi:hypothetical protein